MSWAKPADAARWQRAFGEQVRRVRQQRGLSQMQLALLADMDPTYLSSVEQGRRNISLVNIHALAERLEVGLGAFFAEDEPGSSTASTHSS